MNKAIRPAIFKWRQTQPELILCAVRRYLRYSLSFRNVEELLSQRVKSGLAAARARGKTLGRQPSHRPKSDRLFNILKIPQYQYGRTRPTPTVIEPVEAG